MAKQLTLRRRGGAALMYAAEEGHKETVKLLVELGAEVDAMNNQGWTGA